MPFLPMQIMQSCITTVLNYWLNVCKQSYIFQVLRNKLFTISTLISSFGSGLPGPSYIIATSGTYPELVVIEVCVEELDDVVVVEVVEDLNLYREVRQLLLILNREEDNMLLSRVVNLDPVGSVTFSLIRIRQKWKSTLIKVLFLITGQRILGAGTSQSLVKCDSCFSTFV